MTVNLIVLLASLLVVGFLVVWLTLPALRPWMELPKQQFLQRQRAFPPVERGAADEQVGGTGYKIGDRQ